MNLLGGIWKYALAGAGLVIAGLAFALKLVAAQKAAEKADKLRYKAKAAGEKAARKHVTDTVETTRETEDDIRRDSPDARRRKLREYSSGAGPDDPD